MKAQEARGADFDSGNLIQKAKSGSFTGTALYLCMKEKELGY